MRTRCGWVGNDPLYAEYHDKEWGVPVHDDRKWFENILLDSAQAGLSWITILRKREGYRTAYDNFDYRKVAQYSRKKVEDLLGNAGIVRNRRKIESSIRNARVFLAIQEEFGSFDTYVWRFVGGTPKVNSWKSLSDVPASTKDSEALSKDLIRRGCSFVGPTICYAFMQAGGMVKDHVVTCFRYREILEMR
ncbi:DNA-3-methyladenine glycosylase I [candidate division KSB3 bacterium]|uniref:DNA-3-methyladenine glycosylase I n=1 Tax=candidate division KSB3 bacterium TaxID=2044937 RepID=A0A2G6EAK9_9BACT|nr:MAG: DNA-3-methyladenine glycosylase I [candidate division KSB3 bacterium]PIE30709.1 MAG: DNA-3-methyladenine glycosylase I [candidate division KSB3 bacterium]